jgi:predicted amidophosphoribosyltransferase
VPARGPDICRVCHTAVDGWPTCYPCGQSSKIIGAWSADAVSFVSLAPRDEQMATELASYKDPRTLFRLRQQKTFGLAAVLLKWLLRHERCLARRTGSETFDIVTSVPSTKGRTPHPLAELAALRIVGSPDRYRDLLVVNRTDMDDRAHAVDRYRVDGALKGQRVLVIDDTWTTGAHAQSASAALKSAGASGVGVVAIGRWFNPGYQDQRSWLTRHRAVGWDWSRCCLEPRPH